MGTIFLYCLCVFLLLVVLRFVVKFLHKVWWTPIHVQQLMRSQGIKGPAYKFLHGSTKEIIRMREDSISRPMELSHGIYPRIQPHIHSWTKLYGKIFLTWYGPQAILVVTEPDLIKEILNNKDGAYPKTEVRGYVKKLVGDGLPVAEGEKWSKLRKLSNHAFHAENLKGLIPAMIAGVEDMLKRWKSYESKEIEVYQEFRILTSEVISRTAFGSSYIEGKNIFDMLTKLATIISRNDFKVRIPGAGKLYKSSDDIEADETEQRIHDTIMAMIKKREEKVMTGEADSFGIDFLGSLIGANHESDEKKRVTVEEMVDECKTFYSAGQETTNTLLAWSTLLLAIHTDWQEKARLEVLELLGQESLNSEGIARMKIMSMIINETLRLYCPVVNITRRVRNRVRLGKLTLPANMNVLIPPLALHHDPEIWGEDVHLFKPERFAEGVAKVTNSNTTAYLPFGFGLRSCVGLSFALAEAKIGLSMILQRYKFTLSPTYVHSPFQLLTIRPQHGLQILLHEL